MQVSLDWLGEFVELPATDTLVSQLTDAGIEVEEVLIPGEGISGVVVARVESSRTQMRINCGSVRLMTEAVSFIRWLGAPNVRAGMTVAYARVGAKLPEFKISKRKLRGVVSLGMLCGKSELGLEDEIDGLWDLPEGLELGASVFEALAMQGSLALGLTPNRPDLLSHVGVAREVAAVTGAEVRQMQSLWSEDLQRPVPRRQVHANEPCPRYVARYIRNVKAGTSPQWLRPVLRRLD